MEQLLERFKKVLIGRTIVEVGINPNWDCWIKLDDGRKITLVDDGELEV